MKWANAVLEGGGVKAIGLVGALWEAERRGYRWLRIGGTSAGALVGSLVAAGYTAAEIVEDLNALDFSKFMDKGTLDRIPGLGPVASLIFELGIFEGDYLERWIAGVLSRKGVTTFRDLRSLPTDYDGPQITGGPKYRLAAIASDISRGRLVVLPDDLTEYSIDPDRMSVARAVRMSCSIPFFYEPVKIPEADRSGRKLTRSVSYIVDGGLLSNYPVWLFDTGDDEQARRQSPSIPTFGFKLVGPSEAGPRDIKGPVSLLSAIVATMLEAHDERHIREADFARTIAIPTAGVKTTDFDLSEEQKRLLFESGVKAAAEFFDNWDFRTYLARYSSHKASGRNRGEPSLRRFRS